MSLEYRDIGTCTQLIELVNEIGFLPLLPLKIKGWSADEQTSEDCKYTTLPDGGWEWPVWEWKGPIIQESGCAYGKFFHGKAGFISREWWPDFYNWRRSRFPLHDENSIEAMILATLQEHGSLITRKLRAACGFTGTNMRGKFDSYLTRLEMGGYIVTEDFIYPHDKHGKRYGWGWSLLTTPELRFGHEACPPDRTPEESYERLTEHFKKLFPDANSKTLDYILK